MLQFACEAGQAARRGGRTAATKLRRIQIGGACVTVLSWSQRVLCQVVHMVEWDTENWTRRYIYTTCVGMVERDSLFSVGFVYW